MVATVTVAESETVTLLIEPKAEKVYDLVELGSVSLLVNGVIPDCGEKLVFAKLLLLSVTKTPVGLDVTEIVSVSPGVPVVLDGEMVMVLVGVVSRDVDVCVAGWGARRDQFPYSHKQFVAVGSVRGLPAIEATISLSDAIRIQKHSRISDELSNLD